MKKQSYSIGNQLRGKNPKIPVYRGKKPKIQTLELNFKQLSVLMTQLHEKNMMIQSKYKDILRDFSLLNERT